MKKPLLAVLALSGAVLFSQGSVTSALAQDSTAKANAPAGSQGSLEQDIGQGAPDANRTRPHDERPHRLHHRLFRIVTL